MAGYIGNTQKISGSYTVDEFTSSGGTTYTLSKTPGAKNNIQVSAGGLTQYPSAYSVSGTTLTLSGVPSGQKVVVRHMGDTIPYPLLADDAVTSAKIANDAVTGAKLNPALVAGDVIYADGTDTINRLAKGTAAQVLTMNAGATAPEWAATAGGGKILQIVSSTTAAGSGWNTASTSLVDVGGPWTVAITCAATSSKVLVIASLSVTVQDYVNAQADGSVILVRDSTALTNVNNAANFGIEIGAETGGWTRTSNHGTLHILDSPSSTSELVYKLQYACKSGDAIYISYHGQSTITLMEIGA